MTLPIDSICFPILDTSQVGEARRAAMTLANRLGFQETQAGKLAIVVTEAATNLIKHARDGQIVLCADTRASAIDLLALDTGPGIADVGRSLHDGYSTAGTTGTGLGAIKRLADEFEIYSQPRLGTAIYARVRARPIESSGIVDSSKMGVGAVCLPVKGEQQCGDAWAETQLGDRTTIVLIDGLGHGPNAAEAAQAGIEAFREQAGEAPERILESAHAALRATRGAAMAVCDIDRTKALIRFAGVGNIAGVVIPPEANDGRHFVSHAGTLGHEARRFQAFDYRWTPKSVVVLHSDGLTTRWRLDTSSGLRARHPALIAGVLYRDFRRGNDDVTVVVAKCT